MVLFLCLLAVCLKIVGSNPERIIHVFAILKLSATSTGHLILFFNVI